MPTSTCLFRRWFEYLLHSLIVSSSILTPCNPYRSMQQVPSNTLKASNVKGEASTSCNTPTRHRHFCSQGSKRSIISKKKGLACVRCAMKYNPVLEYYLRRSPVSLFSSARSLASTIAYFFVSLGFFTAASQRNKCDLSYVIDNAECFRAKIVYTQSLCSARDSFPIPVRRLYTIYA